MSVVNVVIGIVVLESKLYSEFLKLIIVSVLFV